VVAQLFSQDITKENKRFIKGYSLKQLMNSEDDSSLLFVEDAESKNE
jgi:hypothetical protein